MKVTLVDYGAGNLPSVERAFRRLGAETERATAPESLRTAQAIVLPGVGHFAALMRSLEQHGLLASLRDGLTSGIPFLGICLGLQALFQASEEAPNVLGLGLLPGTVQSLPPTAKLPHMGWNQVRSLRPSTLLRDVTGGAYFYFAHSYAALALDSHATAVCEHGTSFVAALECKNLLAVQFHPEKSGAVGAQVLCNFLEFPR